MTNVVRSLSDEYPDSLVILLCDEVKCNESLDWSNMETCHNVIWCMAINPRSNCFDMKIVPPTSDDVLSQQLQFKYRNCHQIRQFYKWWISHTNESKYYIDMSSDQELDPEQLPRGQTPIWIQPPEGASQVEMMERVLKIPELEQYKDNVTVLYRGGKMDDDVMDMCYK